MFADDWRVGDRMFAPWEPQWLYPGTILCIDREVAFIRFDDDDRAIIPLTEIKSVSIRVGGEVQCRRDREVKTYWPAEVLAVTDDEIRVRYDDGDEDRVPISHCRIAARPVIGYYPNWGD